MLTAIKQKASQNSSPEDLNLSQYLRQRLGIGIAKGKTRSEYLLEISLRMMLQFPSSRNVSNLGRKVILWFPWYILFRKPVIDLDNTRSIPADNMGTDILLCMKVDVLYWIRERWTQREIEHMIG